MRTFIVTVLLCLVFPLSSFAYPIDGYMYSGIRRLLKLERIILGDIKARFPPDGALLISDSIQLNLTSRPLIDLPATDEGLQEALDDLFPNRRDNYSVALLEMSPGQPIRYAERRGERGFQPGSVGKLAVMAALFCELENIYPHSYAQRVALLKERVVVAGPWALVDEHTVPFYELEGPKHYKRQVRETDKFSLFEWADHMVSVSNNGAASVLWRETILMRAFQQEYLCLNQLDADEYFKNTPRRELMDIATDVVSCPLIALGIAPEEWRLGKLFTRGASALIPGQGGSIGSPRGLMKFLMAMESGRVIDPASSLEMKRLMYITDRRIRYGASDALDEAALYFKSGSYYSCDPNKSGSCGKYAGNRFNYMNSVAIVEQPDGSRYISVLMTNVLSKNSNWDHRRLAGQIDEILKAKEEPSEIEAYDANASDDEPRGE